MVINKIRKDVPLLAGLPDGAVNLYRVDTAPDQVAYQLEVAGRFFDAG